MGGERHEQLGRIEKTNVLPEHLAAVVHQQERRIAPHPEAIGDLQRFGEVRDVLWIDPVAKEKTDGHRALAQRGNDLGLGQQTAGHLGAAQSPIVPDVDEDGAPALLRCSLRFRVGHGPRHAALRRQSTLGGSQTRAQEVGEVRRRDKAADPVDHPPVRREQEEVRARRRAVTVGELRIDGQVDLHRNILSEQRPYGRVRIGLRFQTCARWASRGGQFEENETTARRSLARGLREALPPGHGPGKSGRSSRTALAPGRSGAGSDAQKPEEKRTTIHGEAGITVGP